MADTTIAAAQTPEDLEAHTGSLFDFQLLGENPFPLFKMLRATQPVVRIADNFWAVAKYDDVLRILRDPETFSSRVGGRLRMTGTLAVDPV